MRTWISCLLVVSLWSASMPVVALAKGGGHGGGSHGGGHASGGHASGGHASSPGHASATAHVGHPASRTAAAITSTTPSSGHARNGQPIVGTAVPRPSTTSPFTVTPSVIVPTRIWPYYGGLVGAGAFYDPFFWNRPSPWYGADVPLSATGPDSDAPPLDPFGTDGPTGSLRLKVEPTTAEVFVDGYYAGVVDDFDGLFHHLNLGVGPHHLEVRAVGYEPLGVEVYILARHTIVYRGVLLRSHE